MTALVAAGAAPLDAIDRELAHLDWTAADLATLPPSHLLPFGPSPIIAGYHARRAALSLHRAAVAAGAQPLPLQAFRWSGPPPPAPLPASPRPVAAEPPARPAPARVSPPPASPPRPPRPSKTAPPEPAFADRVAEHALAILGFSGAFLLLVAAVLLELYGGLGSAARFGVVAGLHAGFLGAGVPLLRVRSFRTVATSYVATGALLAPISWLAGVDAFGGGSAGMTAAGALALNGTYCALLYGALSIRLRAGAYTVLGAAGLAVGLGGAVTLVAPAGWAAVTTGLLTVGSALLPRVAGDAVAWCRRELLLVRVAAAAVAAGTAVVFGTVDLAIPSASMPVALYLPLTLCLLAASLGVDHWRTRAAAAIVLLTDLAGITAVLSFRGDRTAVLVAVAAGTLVAAALHAAFRKRPEAVDLGVLGAVGAVAVAAADTVPEPWRTLLVCAAAVAVVVPAMVHRSAALAMLAGVVPALAALANLADITAQPTFSAVAFLPAGAASVTAGLAATLVMARRRDLSVVALAGAFATALLMTYAAGGGVDAAVAVTLASAVLLRLAASALGRDGVAVDLLALSALVGATAVVGANPDLSGLAVTGCVAAVAAWTALERHRMEWLAAGVAALATRVAVVAAEIPATMAPTAAAPRLLFLPLGLCLLALASLAMVRRTRAAGAVEVTAVLSTAAALTACYSAAFSFDVTALVLAACGLGWAAAAAVSCPPTAARLLDGASLQLLAASVLPIGAPTRTAVVCAAIVLAAVRSLLAGRPVLLALALPALGVQIVAASTGIDPAIATDLRLLPIPLAVFTLALMVTGRVRRDGAISAPALVASISATALVSAHVFGAPLALAGVLVVAVGLTATAMAVLPGTASGRDRTRLLALAHLGAALALPTGAAWTEAMLLAVASAVAVWTVVESGQRILSLVPVALGLGAWWFGAVAVTGGAGLDTAHVARVFAVLPPVTAAVAAALWRSVRLRPAAEILRIVTAAVAVMTTAGSLTAGDQLAGALQLLGWSIAADVVAVIAGETAGAAIAVAGIAAGATLLGSWAGLTTVALPGPALGVVALVWAAGASPALRGSMAAAHRLSAAALAAVTALACLLVPDFTSAGSGPVVPAAATALAAMILAAEVLLTGDRRWWSGAAVTGSLVVPWLAAAAGATRPEVYTTVPAVAVIGCSLAARRHIRGPVADLIGPMVAAGAAVLLGIPALEALGEAPGNSSALVWLLGVSTAALLAGVGARDRTLVVCAAAALLGTACRAVFLTAAQVPLYVDFGVAAMVLLSVAGVLAVAREHVAAARRFAAGAWQEWS